jgi:hypothetical protein
MPLEEASQWMRARRKWRLEVCGDSLKRVKLDTFDVGTACAVPSGSNSGEGEC